MKKGFCYVLTIIMIMSFAVGCGSKKDRILYNDINLSKFVTLGDYKSIPVDTNSDTYNEFRKDVISSDITDNEFYVHKTEGKVADGDTVNIDYTGKKDGVAFEGGTAKGSDLKIGSNSFIDGFESGIIGVNIGDTVDLNLTFPENYQSTDLAGKAVVFTVKINYVKTKEAREAEDYCKDLGFKTEKEYNADVKKRAIKNYLMDTVKANAKINDYPEDDLSLQYDSVKKMIENNIKRMYNIDLATYLKSANQTEDEFKNSLIKEQIKPEMDKQMITYAILDKEKLEVTKTDISKKISDMLKQINSASITEEELKEYYGEYYFEYQTVSDNVIDFLYENAKIS